MANTFLQRNFTNTPTSQTTMTYSFWVKKSALATGNSNKGIFGHVEIGNAGNSNLQVGWTTNNDFQIGYYSNNGSDTHIDYVTNAQFKDNNGWYHVCIEINTTLATADDRVKLYINGVLVTSYSTRSNPPQNRTINTGNMYMYIGQYRQTGGTEIYLDGLLSEFIHSDGYAYSASTFGETDTDTGEWRIKDNPTFTPGNQGFKILSNGSTITDQSAGSNDFTVAGGTLTNTNDCPSNVFATLNSLDSDLTTDPFQYGNTKVSGQNPESAKYYCGLTLGMMGNGKYYFEGQLNVNNQGILGVCNLDASDNPTYLRQQNTFPGRYSSSWGYDFTDGYKFNNNNKTAYGSGTSWTANDYFSFALDNTNGKMYIAKNGSWVSGGDPTNGTGGIDYSAIGDNNMFIVADNNSGGYNKFTFNFGNGSFDTTTLSTTYSPTVGDTSAKFKYNIIPTGYTALSTKGLNI